MSSLAAQPIVGVCSGLRRQQQNVMNTIRAEKKLRAWAIGAVAAVSLPVMLYAGAGTARAETNFPAGRQNVQRQRDLLRHGKFGQLLSGGLLICHTASNTAVRCCP